MTKALKAQSKIGYVNGQETKPPSSRALVIVPTGQEPQPSVSPAQPRDHGQVRVLVYGSLKQACGNSALMSRIGAEWIGYDSITGDFSMMSFGGFPGVVRLSELRAGKKVTTIFGELYATDEEGLASLDLLESHPNWYERFKYRTDIHDRRAWMYTLPSDEGYLDTNSYASVPAAIWQETPEELKFWAENGATIDVDASA